MEVYEDYKPPVSKDRWFSYVQKQGKADPDDIVIAKCKYQAQLDEYKEFSKKFNLPEQRERIYADLKGRVAPSQRTYRQWQVEQAQKKARKSVAKGGGSDIIKSGAVSGARNPYGKAAKEHAARYYGLVRSMKTDVERIAKVTGYSEEQIRKIKNYIFMDKHDLGGVEPARFDPDYMMGESWRRMIDGKPEPHDLTLLKHEIMEEDLMKQGYAQKEAHILTSAKYNYDKEATEFYDKIKKYKKE